MWYPPNRFIQFQLYWVFFLIILLVIYVLFYSLIRISFHIYSILLFLKLLLTYYLQVSIEHVLVSWPV